VVWLEDFKLIKVIGEGAFGKVFLVKNEDLDRVYAMKTIRKDKIIEYDQLESTKLEKTILRSVI
jgi:serine/threonine protein kinase